MLIEDNSQSSGPHSRVADSLAHSGAARTDHGTEKHGQKVGPSLDLDADGVESLSRLFKLLSDKTRLTILRTLAGGEVNVTTLCALLKQAQPTVSHHLGLLRQSRLISNRRQGKQVFYRLDDRIVRAAMLPRDDDDDGVSLDGSTKNVGHHPSGLQLVLPGLVVQVVSNKHLSDAISFGR